ncbi:MAG: hypothetical protein ACP5I6_00555 [Caldisphaera sp.]|nr:hypothetical protein [Caldisphaera sp.]PMP88194.1 MAG: hypothetical protein C0172_03220 [Caldisphaera sp.]
MKLKSYSSAIFLGFPIPNTENPYIAVPTSEVEFEININECKNTNIKIENLPLELNSYIKDFWMKLNEGMNFKNCAEIKLINKAQGYTFSGLYAVSTSLLLYSLGKYNNETLNENEIIELTRIVDNIDDPSWASVMDSLRYSSITGKAVVYRNEEESSELNKKTIKIKLSKIVSIKPQIIRDIVGNDVYGAITHLMGVSVLEASLRIKESNDFDDTLNKFRKITDSVSYLIYGLIPNNNCFYVPGLPNIAELICLE